MNDTVKRMKSQVTDWEKYLEVTICDKGLASRIYKASNKEANNPIKMDKRFRKMEN